MFQWYSFFLVFGSQMTDRRISMRKSIASQRIPRKLGSLQTSSRIFKARIRKIKWRTSAQASVSSVSCILRTSVGSSLRSEQTTKTNLSTWKTCPRKLALEIFGDSRWVIIVSVNLRRRTILTSKIAQVFRDPDAIPAA